MTDEEINDAVKSVTETCLKSSSAMAALLQDAFCLLAQQPCIDRQVLLDGLRSLKREDDQSVMFQATYNLHKAKLLEQIEIQFKEQTSQGKS